MSTLKDNSRKVDLNCENNDIVLQTNPKQNEYKHTTIAN